MGEAGGDNIGDAADDGAGERPHLRRQLGRPALPLSRPSSESDGRGVTSVPLATSRARICGSATLLRREWRTRAPPPRRHRQGRDGGGTSRERWSSASHSTTASVLEAPAASVGGGVEPPAEDSAPRVRCRGRVEGDGRQARDAAAHRAHRARRPRRRRISRAEPRRARRRRRRRRARRRRRSPSARRAPPPDEQRVGAQDLLMARHLLLRWPTLTCLSHEGVCVQRCVCVPWRREAASRAWQYLWRSGPPA